MPLAMEALRACTTRTNIWFWGDQALIDIEARNSLVGRNLLGVYDRYGWHHLGPMWLLVLGVFRWLGGGSPVAVALGSYVLQAAAAAAIVVVANRLRPGLTAWWAAIVLLGYEWSFGLERLGTVWAPYTVACPRPCWCCWPPTSWSASRPVASYPRCPGLRDLPLPDRHQHRRPGRVPCAGHAAASLGGPCQVPVQHRRP